MFWGSCFCWLALEFKAKGRQATGSKGLGFWVLAFEHEGRFPGL